ncbi:uncharacterized protein G2W53_000832 [Senna tora]|uniref:Uncharacterized protein n=1 Tax=Senna tora TaxID=362788 RepID=A0A834XF28_9FABA|nr:uncharacterized protein G2W53_000832 [Senna tora]
MESVNNSVNIIVDDDDELEILNEATTNPNEANHSEKDKAPKAKKPRICTSDVWRSFTKIGSSMGETSAPASKTKCFIVDGGGEDKGDDTSTFAMLDSSSSVSLQTFSAYWNTLIPHSAICYSAAHW